MTTSSQVYLWCTCGVYTCGVYTCGVYTCGVPVVYLWCTCGVPVVYLWCTCAPVVPSSSVPVVYSSGVPVGEQPHRGALWGLQAPGALRADGPQLQPDLEA